MTPVQTAFDEQKEKINNEYTQWCAKAGDVQYKLMCFKGELEFINNKLKSINEEATKLSKEQSNGSTRPETISIP